MAQTLPSAAPVDTSALGSPVQATYEMDEKTEPGVRNLGLVVMSGSGLAGIGLLVAGVYLVATGYRDVLGLVGAFGAGGTFAFLLMLT